MTCTHDLTEREVAAADGYCPLCLADEIERLRAALTNLVIDVQDYPAWQRPCLALDEAKKLLAARTALKDKP